MLFLAEGRLAGAPPAALLEPERHALDELKQHHLVTAAYLSSDRTGVFLLLDSDTETSARIAIGELPLVQAGVLTFSLTALQPL